VCAQPFGMGQGTIVPCDAADLVNLADPRVSALVALSPQGPDTEGFMTDSFATLDRPILMGTGLSDGDVGEPESRLGAFDLIPPGERWLIYLDDPGARHGLFGGSVAPCIDEIGDPARCEELRAWLAATVLAFLDDQLRDVAAARAWIESDSVEIVSGGTATLTAK
jgi:hypothetical protein